MILSGARGSGRYTLALMLAKTLICLNRPDRTDRAGIGGPPDFCGHCRNCLRIADSENLTELVAEAAAARESLGEADRKETRILIQTHPDVLIVPPDPPQLLIKIGQVRTVVERLHRAPADASRSIAIFTSSAFMKEAANSLLKILEEPPENAHILLLAENPGELLPTIRSRAGTYFLAPLPSAEIEAVIGEKHPEWRAQERSLVARLANGAVGRAFKFNLDDYLASRRDALLLVRSAAGVNDPGSSALFHATEAYRAGAQGQEKTQALLGTLRGLLEDILYIHSGAAALVRNIDLVNELEQISNEVDVDWIESAAKGITQVEQGMRRNLLRSLSLDAFTFNLGGALKSSAREISTRKT